MRHSPQEDISRLPRRQRVGLMDPGVVGSVEVTFDWFWREKVGVVYPVDVVNSRFRRDKVGVLYTVYAIRSSTCSLCGGSSRPGY